MQKKIYSVDSKFDAEIVTSEKKDGKFVFSDPNKLPYNIDLLPDNASNHADNTFIKKDLNSSTGEIWIDIFYFFIY